VGVTALAVDLVTEYDADTSYPDALIDAFGQIDAPLAALTSLPSAIDRPTVERLRAEGIPVLEGARSGIAALGHLACWPLTVDAPAAAVDPMRQERWRARLRADWSVTSSFALLADYAVPVAETCAAGCRDEVLAAAAAIGYPVALKTVAAEHKSDVGGVVLGLGDPAALQAAYTTMARSLGAAVTLSAMADGGIELSVGVVRDPSFGPLVVVAAGGTLVELLADRVVACPPISARGARRLLDGLRIRPLLGAWRGRAAVDLDALADVIVGFSTLAVELGDALDAAEANPVIVSPRGAVAVDALVIPARS